MNKNVLRCLLKLFRIAQHDVCRLDCSKCQVRHRRMNVLRNQWSVSGQTVAVMQLSRSDEMGCVERGVLSSIPGHQSCSLYAPTPLSCRRCVRILEASRVVEEVLWHRLDHWCSGLHELHCFVLFVTCQQWPLEHSKTASCSNRVDC